MLDNAFLAVLNHLLAAAPWARERLQPHAGLVARLQLDTLGIDFCITPQGLAGSAAETAAADVVLSLPLAGLPQLALGGVDEVMRQVHLQGNAEFADALGFVFRNLRWDAEEDLARLLGDVAAHRLADGARSVAATQRRMLDGATGNLAEYLTEEAQMLVSRAAARQFDDELRALRDAVARTEKRIDRLERPRR